MSPRYDQIQIRRLTVDCVIGVYPHERTAPQPLTLDVELRIPRAADRDTGLHGSVDYAKTAAQLRFLLESCAFLLLETAAEALCAYLLAPPTGDCPQAQCESVVLTLEKPNALAGAIPSLTVERDRSDYAVEHETKGFGKVDVIYETSDCGIYRLRVAPGNGIPTHVHRKMDEREMLLSSGMLLQGEPMRAGSVVSWKHDVPHRYDNPTTTERTILCVDRPAFIPDDEIVVDAETRPATTLQYYPEAASD